MAERYVALALALAKHQPSLLDVGLAAPAASGAREPAPVLRARMATLRAEAERLWASGAPGIVQVAASPGGTSGDGLDAVRARYLLGQIRALDVAAGRLVGESARFADEARIAFGVALPHRDAAALDGIRRELADRLTGTGTLAERHATYRRAMAVPRDRLALVFDAGVAWCREAARTWMPLPEGETLTTRAADESGWEAFSRPTGPLSSDLWVARDGGSDAAHVLQLAAHEGTPGHHAQHVLSATRLVDRRHWQERTLTPSFGPHRLLAEGAAEAGAELLLPLDVRERVCAEILLPAAGQRPSLAPALVRIERLAAALDIEVAYIAADYLDGSMPSVDAAARLQDEALLLDPGGMVSFVEKQRSKVLAYPVGRRLVARALGNGSAAEHWARLSDIATTLTLPTTEE